MKFILNNPTKAQLAEIKKLGLPVVYLSGTEIHIEVPEISEEDLTEISEEDLTPGDVVDLGLPSGLKWASCNIGADKPCDYGLLFQWGRVDGYAYGDSNHKFTGDAKQWWYPDTTTGTEYYGADTLKPADDAAYVATNGKLRIPTKTEIDELLTNTTHKWVSCTVFGKDHTEHTVYGALFTSKTNDNTIFIPAAGFFDGGYNDLDYSGQFTDGLFTNANSFVAVWSATVGNVGAGDDTEDDTCAYYLGANLKQAGGNCGFKWTAWRGSGFSVRGVCE